MLSTRATALRPAVPKIWCRPARVPLDRALGRRSYASGHRAGKTSDMPWIIGSAAVFLPATAFLFWSHSGSSDHGEAYGEHQVEDAGASGDQSSEEPAVVAKEEESDGDHDEKEANEEVKKKEPTSNQPEQKKEGGSNKKFEERAMKEKATKQGEKFTEFKSKEEASGSDHSGSSDDEAPHTPSVSESGSGKLNKD